MVPSPHHRHQSSLEDTIDFSAKQALLEPGRRARAEAKFFRIVKHFEAASAQDEEYNRPGLVRLTYEHSRSTESKDVFLRAFFPSIGLTMDDQNDADLDDDQVTTAVGSLLFGFADYLLQHFFLPLRASSLKTPQPSPVYHGAIERAQGAMLDGLIGTPVRLRSLRDLCLERDRHCCVVSRRFDRHTGEMRLKKYGSDAKDDNGNLLPRGQDRFAYLEAAHILPHSLIETKGGSELSDARKATLAILDMFDRGVIHLIQGVDIDQPRNAMMLSQDLHRAFGEFQIFFEPVHGQEHTYRIDSVPGSIGFEGLPVTRSLYLAEGRTIDAPLPRFLALHAAIAHILHLSAAGDYIDKILTDMEDKVAKADGSTELGYLVALGLGGFSSVSV